VIVDVNQGPDIKGLVKEDDMAPMKLEIITAEQVIYSDDVDALVAPGVEGELGILPYHASLITALMPGEIMVRKDGTETYLAVSGGFLEMIANKVTILADAAERSEEIDEARVQEAMKRAQERMDTRSSDMDLARAVASLRRSEARLKVVQRRRFRPSALTSQSQP
jgi:F-type H+-transporting ATPase subunit epsilon